LSKDDKHGTPEGNESAGDYKDRKKMSPEFKVFGIEWSPEEIRERITKRAGLMFCDDLYKETKFLVEKYGWDSQAMKSNIYPIVRDMVEGRISREEAIELFITDDWHLAKRQLTWFHRNPNIIWLPLDRARDYILNSYT
jgi:tRNA dimethylallyltransferase